MQKYVFTLSIFSFLQLSFELRNKSANIYHKLNFFSPIFPRLAKRSPNEEREYVIQALDGPAAGCTLTHNSDRRSNFSDWVHTQPTFAKGRYEKWQIQKYEAKPHPIYKIKAKNGRNGEHTQRKQ